MHEMTYPSLLLPRVEQTPDRDMLVTRDGSVTYGAHLETVLRLVSAMRSRSGMALDGGDTFAVLSRPSAWYVALWHAALFGGGVLNAVNTRFSDRELEEVLRTSRTRVLFADDDMLPAAERIRGSLPDLRLVVALETGSGDLHVSDLMSAPAAGPPDVRSTDRALINFTGGTTGSPAGVVYSQAALVMNVLQNNLLLDYFDFGTKYLSALPLYHIGAAPLTLGMPASGNTAVLLPNFDAAEVIRQIHENRCTLTAMVPTMIATMLDHPDFEAEKLSSLRRLAYGSAPMTQALLTRLRNALPDLGVATAFGTTETGPISVLSADMHRTRPDLLPTVGRPMPGVEIRIGASSDEVAVPGVVGEIWVRTPSQMTGYLDASTDRDGGASSSWHRTGDIGSIDVEGFLTLSDRAKDMIISGGENVYCLEVENAIATHPDVAQVAVVGKPDPRWGETVHAIVALRPEASPDLSADEIVNWARRSIAGYKVPRSVDIRREPLPLSPVGKILKRVLRESLTTQGS